MNICVITKGDKKLAEIITKKYLRKTEEKFKLDDKSDNNKNIERVKLGKEEKMKDKIMQLKKIIALSLQEKIVQKDRFLVSGQEINNDWQHLTNLENLDEPTKDQIRA